MANPSERVPENAPGDFFVDSTCIDCDTCRQVARRCSAKPQTLRSCTPNP